MQHSFLFCVLYKNTWHVKNGIIFRVTVIQTMLHKERKLFCVLIVLLLCSGIRGKALEARMLRCLECKYAKMLDGKMQEPTSLPSTAGGSALTTRWRDCGQCPRRWAASAPSSTPSSSTCSCWRDRLWCPRSMPWSGETLTLDARLSHQYSRMNCLYCLCYSLVSVHLRTFFMSNDSTIFERVIDQKLVRDENGSTWNYINICRHAW